MLALLSSGENSHVERHLEEFLNTCDELDLQRRRAASQNGAMRDMVELQVIARAELFDKVPNWFRVFDAIGMGVMFTDT